MTHLLIEADTAFRGRDTGQESVEKTSPTAESAAKARQQRPKVMGAAALGAIGNWQAVDRLVSLFRDPYAEVRTTAAKAAFERGRKLAIEQEHDGPREEMAALLAELE